MSKPRAISSKTAWLWYGDVFETFRYELNRQKAAENNLRTVSGKFAGDYTGVNAESSSPKIASSLHGVAIRRNSVTAQRLTQIDVLEIVLE
jgi:hypothetical protein